MFATLTSCFTAALFYLFAELLSHSDIQNQYLTCLDVSAARSHNLSTLFLPFGRCLCCRRAGILCKAEARGKCRSPPPFLHLKRSLSAHFINLSFAALYIVPTVSFQVKCRRCKQWLPLLRSGRQLLANLISPLFCIRPCDKLLIRLLR